MMSEIVIGAGVKHTTKITSAHSARSNRVRSSGTSSSHTRGWWRPNTISIATISTAKNAQLPAKKVRLRRTPTAAVGDVDRTLAEYRIRDVPAVELTDRKQVQRSRQHARTRPQTPSDAG